MYRFETGYTLRFVNCGQSTATNKSDIEIHFNLLDDPKIFAHREVPTKDAKEWYKIFLAWDVDQSRHNSTCWRKVLQRLIEIRGEDVVRQVESKEDADAELQELGSV